MELKPPFIVKLKQRGFRGKIKWDTIGILYDIDEVQSYVNEYVRLSKEQKNMGVEKTFDQISAFDANGEETVFVRRG